MSMKKVLVLFDDMDMIADLEANIKLSRTVSISLSLSISLVFISQSYFIVPLKL